MTATPAAYTLVPMTRTHVDAALPFEQAMFGSESWTRSGYLTELADRRHRHYLAAEDSRGALLGWGGVMVVADAAEILTVGVLPEHRRAGVARALLAALLVEASRREAREVFLEVRVDNVAAQALYESEGFARLGVRRGYYDAGRVDAVTMRKELTA